MFASVLVANRGEIARRVIRTLHALGIRSVAVYTDADAGAPHVREADAAVRDRLLPVDRGRDRGARAACDALHPGYGFLSENAAFAPRVRRRGDRVRRAVAGGDRADGRQGARQGGGGRARACRSSSR